MTARNQAQIDALLQRLGAAWVKRPELRLGQLVLAVTGDIAPVLGHVEDEELVRAIESIAERP